ncbi:Dyp-type peroxidase [Neptunomonas antarctica]|uniref:Putative iron-dependent peroxidase n=1 Tax=Neptunomonas antarctica TaxID=619304 RepID=A0A1N7NLM6_9GAMM|nr:Dyp-type peroxidase [Neptunomonas antarctica]SIS99276.1 putative iron-dependent peroxidase [Neptunomonas antarctica]
MSANYQSGVIAQANSDALFITLNVKQGQDQQVVHALKQMQFTVDLLKARFSVQDLHAVIAIGSEYWDRLTFHISNPAPLRPALFTSFPVLHGATNAPSTPADILLHLRSNRRDITFELARALMALLGDAVDVVEDVSCFRYLDARDLTGFVDGTENPEGEHRKDVALVGEEDAAFAGGSYIHLQRYIHNLNQWSQQSVKEQEDTYGRTKDDNVEYPSSEKPLTAHTKRASLKDSAGDSIEILRHSMPYGNVTEAGLVFASYCHTPENFTLILKSMVEGDSHGHSDRLMQFTTAVTGQAFFAPPLHWFDEQVC